MILESMRSQWAENPQMPPAAKQFIERLLTGQGLTLIMFVMILPLYSVFGTLGALLGLVFFRKKSPPQAPPAQPPLVG